MTVTERNLSAVQTLEDAKRVLFSLLKELDELRERINTLEALHP